MDFNHVMTVVQKEWRELLKNRAFITYYIYLSVGLGLVIPVFSPIGEKGVSDLSTLALLLPAVIIPSTLVADLFAGEKERKTLETLLSAPIRFKDLFWGKVLFVFFTALLISGVVFISTGGVVFAVRGIGAGEWFFPYTQAQLIKSLVLNLGLSMTIASIGSYISIMARQVKSANIFVFVGAMPFLAPALYLTQSNGVAMGYVFAYGLGLMGVGISVSVVLSNAFTKVKLMNRSR